MTRLERQISEAIRAGRWSISSHADDRAVERHVEVWQIVEGFRDGMTLEENAASKPNPRLLREETLASGESVVAVWAYDKSRRTARLVTVYFEDR